MGTPAHFRESEPPAPSLSFASSLNSAMEFEKHSGRYPSPRDPSSEIYGTFIAATLAILLVMILLTVLAYLCAGVFWRSTGRYSGRHDGSSSAGRLSFAEEDPFFLQGVGLDPSVIENLPTFVCKSENFKDGPVQCAVCLCELEENEKARVLPKCDHSFHVECIDMWFRSHSTCPLCRAGVHQDSPWNAVESSSVRQISGGSSMAGDRVSSHHIIDTEIHGNPISQHAERAQTSAMAEKDII